MRQTAAMHLAPIALRVALGLIFLYYGSGKLFHETPLAPGQVDTLVSIGAIDPPAGYEAPGESGAGDAMGPPAFQLIRVQDEGAPPAEAEAAPETVAAEKEAVVEGESGEDARPTVNVRSLYGLIFPMHDAAQRGHWPGFASSGGWLRSLAWAAAVTEFAGGFFIIVGVFTRLWALSMLGTMVVACWLTQISPHLGQPGAFLGFLPPWPMEGPNWIPAYQTLFFQLIIASAAKAVIFIGPGAIAVDRIIFGDAKKKRKKALDAKGDV